MRLSFPKFLCNLLFFTLTFPVFAQKASFFLVPKWQKGEAHRFELTKGKQVFRGDQQYVENESHQILTMTVVDVTPKVIPFQHVMKTRSIALNRLMSVMPLDKMVNFKALSICGKYNSHFIIYLMT